MTRLVNNLITIIILLSVYCFNNESYGKTIVINNDSILNISSQVEFYDDKNNHSTFEFIKKQTFQPTTTSVPNFGISKSNFWIKFTINNNTNQTDFLIDLSAATLDSVQLYRPNENGEYEVITTGDAYVFSNREFEDPNYVFNVNILPKQSSTFFIKIKSNEAIQLPILFGNWQHIVYTIKNRDILSGIYAGIMLVMILYNLFVFFSVKDKSYLYYVIYITCILLTQTTLQGYTFQYLWNETPFINKYSLIFLPSLSGITGMFFMNVFLKTSTFSKRLYNTSFFLVVPYIIAYVISFIGEIGLGQVIVQLNSTIISIYMLITPIIVLKKGFKPAKFFIVAWSVFLVGVLVFVLKDMEILPFNNLTRYTMQIGSCLETILLSFALADRINIMRKEKDLYQQQAIEALEEKQLLIKEQNITLDRKVKERTAELNDALVNLKQAQAKLVESEKMASLGQLTAGIAHEINNPINFVSSNVFPLRQDINDLKQILQHYETLTESSDFKTKLQEINNLKEELDYETLIEELETIINGIEDGARRTAEIVSGLRNFSRLDQSEVEVASINDCIETTLKIIQSKLKNIHLIKDFGNIPKIECFPGKLNQLFLNTIDNAIHAIHTKNIENGELTIKTYEEGKNLICIIKDNGIGMDEATKNKIFDPFFTTKEVGEGTGLGMSIVHGIVELHGGKMEISSEKNVGTEIKLILPLTLPTWKK